MMRLFFSLIQSFNNSNQPNRSKRECQSYIIIYSQTGIEVLIYETPCIVRVYKMLWHIKQPLPKTLRLTPCSYQLV